MWKRRVSAEFRGNRSKLCKNCAFPQNLHTRKLGEILLFCVISENTFLKFSTYDGKVFLLVLLFSKVPLPIFQLLNDIHCHINLLVYSLHFVIASHSSTSYPGAYFLYKKKIFNIFNCIFLFVVNIIF